MLVNIKKNHLPVDYKKNVDKTLLDLREAFKRVKDEGKTKVEWVLYNLVSLLSTSDMSDIRAVSSQLKLITSVIMKLPKNVAVDTASLSVKAVEKIREAVSQCEFQKASFSIALWYNGLIERLPLQQKTVTKKEMADELKKRGDLLMKNPRDMKGIYQFFVVYSNRRLHGDKGVEKMPFIVKYLQQVFKEVSYDGGYLFTLKSYDNFSKNFGETCKILGEAVEVDETEKVFDIILKLFGYTEKLKEELYENKASIC